MFKTTTILTFVAAIAIGCGGDDSNPMPTGTDGGESSTVWKADDIVAPSGSTGGDESSSGAPDPGPGSGPGGPSDEKYPGIKADPSPVSAGLTYTSGGDCNCGETDTDDGCDGSTGDVKSDPLEASP